MNQGCSPQDLGLGLERTGDRFFEVLFSRAKVLVSALLVLVSKGRSRIYFPDRPIYLFQIGNTKNYVRLFLLTYFLRHKLLI